MAAKIAALLITLVVLISVGVAMLVGMVLAMNGYSESDATWGFGVYIVLALARRYTDGDRGIYSSRFFVK